MDREEQDFYYSKGYSDGIEDGYNKSLKQLVKAQESIQFFEQQIAQAKKEAIREYFIVKNISIGSDFDEMADDIFKQYNQAQEK